MESDCIQLFVQLFDFVITISRITNGISYSFIAFVWWMTWKMKITIFRWKKKVSIIISHRKSTIEFNRFWDKNQTLYNNNNKIFITKLNFNVRKKTMSVFVYLCVHDDYIVLITALVWVNCTLEYWIYMFWCGYVRHLNVLVGRVFMGASVITQA